MNCHHRSNCDDETNGVNDDETSPPSDDGDDDGASSPERRVRSSQRLSPARTSGSGAGRCCFHLRCNSSVSCRRYWNFAAKTRYWSNVANCYQVLTWMTKNKIPLCNG